MAPEVYLDYAATAPVRPEVVDAVGTAMREVGNPSSLHAAGRRARRLVEESRERVAAALGAEAMEVVFTAGGTEADNLAVKGVHWARQNADASRDTIVTSAAEHHAVLDSVRWLADRGARVGWVGVDPTGRVDGDALAALLDDRTSVVSLMWANNEVGAVSPIADIVAIAHASGVPVHTDAVQAVGYLPVDFAASGVDAMSVGAHKFGGPRGVGALVLRRTTKAAPLLHGGGQERDLRSGTVDTASVVGMAVALEETVRMRSAEFERLASLRRDLLARVRAVVPDVHLNGVEIPDEATALPGLLSLSVPGCTGDTLLMVLDEHGIRVSTGSACTSGVPDPSHVVQAMTGDPARSRSTLRISLGRDTSTADVDAFVAAFGRAVTLARSASGHRG